VEVIGFLCVLLGSSTVQLHDSPSSRRACTYSEAGFGSQIGEGAMSGVISKNSILLSGFMGRRTQCRGYS
jgi:hypothetical protein